MWLFTFKLLLYCLVYLFVLFVRVGFVECMILVGALGFIVLSLLYCVNLHLFSLCLCLLIVVFYGCLVASDLLLLCVLLLICVLLCYGVWWFKVLLLMFLYFALLLLLVRSFVLDWILLRFVGYVLFVVSVCCFCLLFAVRFGLDVYF